MEARPYQTKKNLYVILKVLTAMLNKVKKKKNLLDNVFELSIPQILSFHHVINIKVMNQAFYLCFFFSILHLQDLVCIFFSKTFDL